jgi:hypothetical protein
LVCPDDRKLVYEYRGTRAPTLPEDARRATLDHVELHDAGLHLMVPQLWHLAPLPAFRLVQDISNSPDVYVGSVPVLTDGQRQPIGRFIG